ncbi:MAG: DUF4397 domain-containing protein, partial [Aliifodinibius sp.]|nr:DUF4397 domain-containing protein [Fodinibius sp.]
SVACDSDDNNNVTGPGNTETVNIRVIHTSYDAPAVDISIDGATAISSLAYGQSSGYAEIDAGTRNVKVTPAGATTPVVFESDIPLAGNSDYTVYAVDQLTNIDAIISEDSRTPASGKAKIRVLHAAPDAPAVDVKLNSGSGPGVFSNAAFKDITDYVEVDGGNYTFVITPTGSTAEVVVFDPITVSNGTVYTVVAHGTLDNTDNVPFAVRVFIDNDPGDAFADLTTATANVLVTHASPDAPGVDLLVDDIVVNSSALTFPNNTGYLSVDAGSRNIKVNASGTSTTVINADLTLDANTAYSVFAVNTLANIEALVLEDDLTAPASGNARVRFVHLSPDAPAVDITLTDGTVIFGNKSFKEATDFAGLSAGTYDLQVRLAGSNTVVLNLPGIMLEDGKIYTVFAKGLVNGSGDQALGAEIIVND